VTAAGTGLQQIWQQILTEVAHPCPRSAQEGPREHRKRSWPLTCLCHPLAQPTVPSGPTEGGEASLVPPGRPAVRPSAAVTPLYHAIRLWVKGGCRQVLGTQLLAQDAPYGRGELGTPGPRSAVSGIRIWKSTRQ
jgi:hypothetical protein